MANKHIYWEQEKLRLKKHHRKEAIGWMFLTTLFSCVVSALLTCAALVIAIDVFRPEGEAIGVDYFVLFLGVEILVLNLWNEGMRLLGKRLITFLGNLVILFIICEVPVPDFLDDYFDEGLGAFEELFIRLGNYHFGTSVGVPEADAAYQLFGILIFVFLFGVLIQWLSSFLGKKGIMLALPAIVLCLGLIVGLTPGWEGLIILFAGGVLAFYLDCNRPINFKRMTLLTAGTMLAVFVSGTLLAPAAESVYYLNEDWRQFQKNLEDGIKNISLKGLFSSGDVVNNKTPSYKHEEVIRLTVNEIPQNSIYLRGHHCMNYVKGEWEKDKDQFRKSCGEQGIGESEGAETLFRLRYDAAAGASNSRLWYKLAYTGINTTQCYLPYAAALEGEIADFSFSGDYLVEKDKDENSFSLYGWKQTDYAAVLRGSYGVLSEKDNIFFEWYNDFVKDNYLQVPVKQEAVKSLADDMKLQQQCWEYVGMLNTGEHGKETVNAARWLLANMVADKLKSMAAYSLELDELPAGEDAVEYFLMKSREGFCVHFASAGVLILRELGVPARYVTGYLVSKEKLQGVEGDYSVSVFDSDAHAWAEVYLDNYGWVPVEMTAGYSGGGNGDLSGLEEAMDKEEQPQETQPKDQNKEEKESMEASTDREGGERNGKENGDAARQSADPQAVSGAAYAARGKIMSILTGGGAAAAAILLVFAGYKYGSKLRGSGEKQLEGYIRFGYTGKAVIAINRRLYGILARKRRGNVLRLSDEDYLAALKAAFPEIEAARWEKYFEIFRRAAYSQENISVEEAKECHSMYRNIKEGFRRERKGLDMSREE